MKKKLKMLLFSLVKPSILNPLLKLRLNPIMSPNSKTLIGLEFLFYGPVTVGVRVRVGFRAMVRVKVRARVRVLGLGF